MAGNDDGLSHDCITESTNIILEFCCALSGHSGLLDLVVSV